MRSGCVLDLALRLLLLWTGADRHDLVAAWVNDLVKLVSSTATSRAQTDAGEMPEMPSLQLAVLLLLDRCVMLNTGSLHSSKVCTCDLCTAVHLPLSGCKHLHH